MKKMLNISRLNFFTKTDRGRCDYIKSVITFDPEVVSAKRLFLKNVTILSAVPDTSDIFASPFLLVFRRDENLRDFRDRGRLNAEN